ncbi:helix-turn-helix transcriptional regulator [Streptomyces sp. ODS28]|uniref:helix-turn-helix transcriptional regulator n=1 Tax=Streptomyces sp. ODS28 TaxID=3136688 RepID=UPI0031EE3D60
MQREFDAGRLRRARQLRDVQKKTIAERVGVTPPRVSAWFAGEATPPPEKLRALAEALGEDIDDLFPRQGAPDLEDLRCDAGISRKAAAEIIGTSSSVPVRNAERRVRRLDPQYAEKLAPRYGVTVEELRAAENRSFGEEPSEEPGPETPAALRTPTTLAEKITHLLTHLPSGSRPTDADIAEAINERANVAGLVRPSQIRALRTGEREPEEIFEQVPEALLFQGLAAVFDVTPHFFQSDEEMVQQVLETVRFLAQHRDGGVAVQLRGEDGLSADMLAKLNALVAEAKAEKGD